MSPQRPLPIAWAPLCVSAALILGAATCSAPVDVSSQYHIVLQTQAPFVYRGSSIYAAAALWHYVGTDSTQVPNVALIWSGGGGAVEIDPAPGGGNANIFGIARGSAYITVEAPAYGGGTGASASIRVADQVELDTVFPDTVAWGGRLTLAGVRVGSPNDVSVRLNGVNLIPDTLSLIGDVSQTERMSYFIPGNATSGILQVTGFGLIATDSTPITVLSHEVYEPNDQSPTFVQLDTAEPYPPSVNPPSPGYPAIHFFNPALLYEAPGGADSITTDWFHFVSTANTAQPWTFVYYSPAVPRRGAFGIPATLQNGVPVFDAGAFGFDFDNRRLLARCRGSDFEFPVSGTVDSIVLSLQTLPASGIDFVEYTSNAGAYGLGVYAGYRTPANAAIAPDRFEDNDFCNQADSNFLNVPSLKIDLGVASFSDTLTIDTPYEVDWYRFHVATSSTVDIAMAPRTGFNNSALSLYLYRQADLNPVDSATGGTTADQQLSKSLAAGDYYLVVVNTDGQPTAYGMCISEGVACIPPSGSAARGVRRR
ncbi:MAG: PPC domain-containing protein [Gemmatimonadales bacterium]